MTELTEQQRDDWQRILAATASSPTPRPLDVHRLAEIDQRIKWCEWTLTQQPEPPATLQWRMLLADTRDLLTALVETTTTKEAHEQRTIDSSS